MASVRGTVGPLAVFLLLAVVIPAAAPSEAGNTGLSRASSNPIHPALGSKRAHAPRTGFENPQLSVWT